MARYPILDAQGVVVNVIEWDGVAPWTPPKGHTVGEPDDTAQPPLAPRARTQTEEIDELKARLAAVEAKLPASVRA